jgi:hypothetical protein
MGDPWFSSAYVVRDTIRFAEKPWMKVLFADLLWEKNIVPLEKTCWKVRIIRQANKARAWWSPKPSLGEIEGLAKDGMGVSQKAHLL